uniref:Uncharacterized protein n=1 Tax=Arundo donax TaxID=35708 RepID=A0A0A9CN89_ARUDO
MGLHSFFFIVHSNNLTTSQHIGGLTSQPQFPWKLAQEPFPLISVISFDSSQHITENNKIILMR